MREQHLPLDGWISEDGRTVNLTWRDTPRSHRGTVEINRRTFGAIGGQSWIPVEVAREPGLRATDTTTQAGQAYEYRVLRRDDQGIVDVGYWVTGRDLPEVEMRGIAHVIVDQTVFADISLYLDRFYRDLIGDGWQVHSYAAPRHSPHQITNFKAVAGLKARLLAAYNADPLARHIVILVGHLPVILGGKANPDGHEPVPHATDLIYGDVDGKWQITPEGGLADIHLPSDSIEMQVGRIDFAPVSGGEHVREVHLLRAYFDKNTNWRHARLGDLREAYGDGPGLIGEVYGLRNVVGPQAITSGGHHDVGEEHPWLWGVSFGHAAGQIYASDFVNKAVFAINFGSHKQKFQRTFNPMIALLAQPWYPLAVGWGGRPAWWPHQMALGGTIGDVHMRTVNNGVFKEPYVNSMDYIPTGLYLLRNPVWVNLLGDPSLRAFPLSPPSALRADSAESGTRLSWVASPAPNVLGYRVYKAQSGTSEFLRISGPEPVIGLEFVDRNVENDASYMVRAYGRKEVHAGSFRTLSQGIFAQIDRAPMTVKDVELVVSGLDSFVMPPNFNAPSKGLIYGFVEGPTEGRLWYENDAWRYSPSPGFSGTVALRFLVSDNLTSAEGNMSLIVDP